MDTHIKETHFRSIIKAISYRLLGSGATGCLTLIITQKLDFAFFVSIGDFFVKIALYYLHERIWSKIKWGKDKTEYNI
jgi:adenylylsulfate kinase